MPVRKRTKAKAKPKVTRKPPVKKKTEEKRGPTLAQVREQIRKSSETPLVIYEDDSDSTPGYKTRFPRLNRLLGGRILSGAIIELFGFEDSGKTSLAIALAADIQGAAPEGKKHVVLVNYEGPQPWDWWRTLGLKTDQAHFTQLRPRSLEEGISNAYELMKTGEVCCIIMDSVYAASAKGGSEMMAAWRDPKKGDGVGLGLEARQWGKAWTALKNEFQNYEVVCIAVNQMREKIGTGAPAKSWAKPTTTPRGHALKFYAWVRIKVQGGFLEGDKDQDGKRVKLRIVKNKTSENARGIAEYDLIRGEGFDLISDLIQSCLEANLIKHKGGGFYSIGKLKIRGRDALTKTLKERDELRDALLARVESFYSGVDIEDLDGEEDQDE